MTTLRLSLWAILAMVVAVTLGIGAGARAATLRALPLPLGFTIVPEGEHRLMTIGVDGTVYAIVSSTSYPRRARALRWNGTRVAEVFTPAPQRGDDQPISAPIADAIVPAADEAYVTTERTSDGAITGYTFTTERWARGNVIPWRLPSCAAHRYESTRVFAVDHERIALTLDPSSGAAGIDLGDPRSVDANLPRAVILNGSRCTALGTAIVTALRGASAAGFIGYLNGKPSPWYINLMAQQMVAMRWIDGKRRVLGPGIPFATTSSGTVVGTTGYPGHNGQAYTVSSSDGYSTTYSFGEAHAVLWPRDGKPMRLLHGDARSVAWDISESGVVVGMMQSGDGRHHAFRCVAGRVELLDDLPHPDGWRFESAYSIALDGTIVGIATYQRIPTGFVWRPE